MISMPTSPPQGQQEAASDASWHGQASASYPRRRSGLCALPEQIDSTVVAPLSLKTMGSAGYRGLRNCGVSVREAWNTSKSAHGPMRLSQTPALSLALLAKYFKHLGLPSLVDAKV
jgi:hypothetical protein